MIRSIGFTEQGTDKSLTFEPTSTGLRVFLSNNVTQASGHMELSLEDIKLLVLLLQSHIEERNMIDDDRPLIDQEAFTAPIGKIMGEKPAREIIREMLARYDVKGIDLEQERNQATTQEP